MHEHDEKRSRDEEEQEIPSGLAQESSETPPLGGEKTDPKGEPEGEGEARRGEKAMPGIPTEGEPDTSA